MISKEKIEALVKEELEEACEKHGRYLNSHPEKYAVLKEEIEEADEDIKDIKIYLECYWSDIRHNQDEKVKTLSIKLIKEDALKGIQELIQVMAMCDKEIKNCNAATTGKN